MSEYHALFDDWLQCPECDSDNVTHDVGWEEELKIKCHDCGAWTQKA